MLYLPIFWVGGCCKCSVIHENIHSLCMVAGDETEVKGPDCLNSKKRGRRRGVEEKTSRSWRKKKKEEASDISFWGLTQW